MSGEVTPLQAVPDTAVWMPVAGSKLGEHELAGAPANPFIVECLELCTFLPPGMMHSDETFWCSAFMCWTFKHAGLRHTANAGAISWLQYGAAVDFRKPMRWGTILVFRRAGGHHVALYEGERNAELYCLGGNQSNRVSTEPRWRSDLIGARWPDASSLLTLPG